MTAVQQVEFIRARLDDWAAVDEACRPTLALFGAAAADPSIKVADSAGRVLWTADELGSASKSLRIVVDMCEPALARPIGHPDRAWADTLLGALVLIWAEHPDYPKLVHT